MQSLKVTYKQKSLRLKKNRKFLKENNKRSLGLSVLGKSSDIRNRTEELKNININLKLKEFKKIKII